MTTKNINWHNLSTNVVFEKLKSKRDGLDTKEAIKRKNKYGLNVLPSKKSISHLVLFLNQMRSPLVYILLIATIISLLLSHYTDAGVIFFVVLVNTFFGYWQESKADNAIKKLKEIIHEQSKVLRNGKVKLISTAELVIGDVINLSAGNKVPADCRVFEIDELQTVEASLTGESNSIMKHTKAIPVGTSLADRDNMIYMGTLISSGKGKAIVCSTGQDTEIGKISELIKEVQEDKTPLQQKLAKFSRNLTFLIVAVAFLIFIQGYFASRDFAEMFLIVVALAVSAIPEGLLVAVTIILTIGMQYILKRKALVRKLIAAETLGSTSVICTDKTGTLTEGKMRVSQIITADKEYLIIKDGEISESEKSKNLISKISVLCSSAEIEEIGSELEHAKIIGDPTESALLMASIQAGYNVDELRKEYIKKEEIPFDSNRKYMVALFEHKKEKHNHVFIKGAPEKIFPYCSKVMIGGKKVVLGKSELSSLRRKYEALTSKGLRVLGFAYRTGNINELDNSLKELVFLGFAGIKDPLRAEAKDTIKLCQKAGIRPIMITGDHKLTAKAIFEELGVKMDGNIVEGKEIDKWSDEKLEKEVVHIDVYARVEPKHKLRIVDAWQRRGEVVAMTGDGINDAPAIKTADIGIALGSGSDVTKETADIILLDNNFSVIVSAIKQGRIIFDNIRKVILYLLSDSFSEMILIAGSLLFNLPLPILATQILFINLIGDGLPNIAMTLEPGEKGIMDDKPRKRDESILNREMKVLILVISIVTSLVLFGLFIILLKKFDDINYVRTIIFTALATDSLIYAFGVRSLRYSIWRKNPFSNKYLIGAVIISFLAIFAVLYIPLFQKIFHTVNLGLTEWGLILALSLFQVILIEVVKYFSILRQKNSLQKG